MLNDKAVVQHHAFLVFHANRSLDSNAGSTSVLLKVGCRGPLNHTKSDTIALTKCFFDQLQLGKKRKTSMKVPKQKFGKHCSTSCMNQDKDLKVEVRR